MNEQQVEVKDSEFAFVVIKNKDGRYAIANVNNEQTARQPTLEDIYASLVILQRDLDRQGQALAVIGALQQFNGSNQTEGGLVLPNKKFVKRA